MASAASDARDSKRELLLVIFFFFGFQVFVHWMPRNVIDDPVWLPSTMSCAVSQGTVIPGWPLGCIPYHGQVLYMIVCMYNLLSLVRH
ncbi:hypothetical protein F4859DRAFT_234562 [Xylaria cf. heliscus]|nr:hypothetical protein F4859DRAFT_234562 [Xylaria cf. heliscus]